MKIQSCVLAIVLLLCSSNVWAQAVLLHSATGTWSSGSTFVGNSTGFTATTLNNVLIAQVGIESSPNVNITSISDGTANVWVQLGVTLSSTHTTATWWTCGTGTPTCALPDTAVVSGDATISLSGPPSVGASATFSEFSGMASALSADSINQSNFGVGTHSLSTNGAAGNTAQAQELILAPFEQAAATSFSGALFASGTVNVTWNLINAGVSNNAMTSGATYAAATTTGLYGVQVTSGSTAAYVAEIAAILYTGPPAVTPTPTATPTPFVTPTPTPTPSPTFGGPTPTGTATATPTATTAPTPTATATPQQELDVGSVCLGPQCPGQGQQGTVYEGGQSYLMPPDSGTLSSPSDLGDVIPIGHQRVASVIGRDAAGNIVPLPSGYEVTGWSWSWDGGNMLNVNQTGTTATFKCTGNKVVSDYIPPRPARIMATVSIPGIAAPLTATTNAGMGSGAVTSVQIVWGPVQ